MDAGDVNWAKQGDFCTSHSRNSVFKIEIKISVTQHILLEPWQGRVGHHAAIMHRIERAQTLPVRRVHLRHGEVAEVALGEQQILPPQGGTVWMEKHLK